MSNQMSKQSKKYKNHHIFLSVKISELNSNAVSKKYTKDFLIATKLKAFIESRNKTFNTKHTVFLSEVDIPDGSQYLRVVQSNLTDASILVLISSNHEYINASDHILSEVSDFNTLKQDKLKAKDSFKVLFSDDLDVKSISKEILPSVKATNQTITFNTSDIENDNQDNLNMVFSRLLNSIEEVEKLKLSNQKLVVKKSKAVFNSKTRDIPSIASALQSSYQSINNILNKNTEDVITKADINQKQLTSYQISTLNSLLDLTNQVIDKYEVLISKKFTLETNDSQNDDFLPKIYSTLDSIMYIFRNNIQNVISIKEKLSEKLYYGRSVTHVVNKALKKEKISPSQFSADHIAKAIVNFRSYNLRKSPQDKKYTVESITLEYFTPKTFLLFFKTHMVNITVPKK
jgi:hypothetical protein